jgi:hypothetical protein
MIRNVRSYTAIQQQLPRYFARLFNVNIDQMEDLMEDRAFHPFVLQLHHILNELPGGPWNLPYYSAHMLYLSTLNPVDQSPLSFNEWILRFQDDVLRHNGRNGQQMPMTMQFFHRLELAFARATEEFEARSDQLMSSDMTQNISLSITDVDRSSMVWHVVVAVPILEYHETRRHVIDIINEIQRIGREANNTFRILDTTLRIYQRPFNASMTYPIDHYFYSQAIAISNPMRGLDTIDSWLDRFNELIENVYRVEDQEDFEDLMEQQNIFDVTQYLNNEAIFKMVQSLMGNRGANNSFIMVVDCRCTADAWNVQAPPPTLLRRPSSMRYEERGRTRDRSPLPPVLQREPIERESSPVAGPSWR